MNRNQTRSTESLERDAATYTRMLASYPEARSSSAQRELQDIQAELARRASQA